MTDIPTSVIIDQAQAIDLHQRLHAAGILPLWVVCFDPADFPNLAVARPQYGSRDPTQGFLGVIALRECLVAPTVEAVRALLPPFLTRMDRDPHDQPQIREIWL
jgi:hypothetical protein